MANNTKKKGLLVGLGIFWAAAITAVGVSIPFVIKNNQTKEKPIVVSNENEFVKTSLINNNEHQIQIKVSNLEDYVGQWLKVEYKQQNNANVALVSSSNAMMSRSFYVRNATEIVAIGGLVPNIKYDYLIKNNDGKVLSSDAVFWTYSKAELNIESDESSISFKSTELNKEYLANSIVVRYKPFENSVDSTNGYNNTKELSVALELKEIEGRKFWAISGKINDLSESTAYVISLHIRGQEGTITDPIVAWTRGNKAKIIATNVAATSAKAQISGLDDYIESPNPLVSFYIKYAEVGNPTSTSKASITIGDEAVIEQPISALKHNTQYSMTLIKLEDELEEVLTQEAMFWTKPEPFVQTKTYESIETSWRKSDVNALVTISGLASKSGKVEDSLNSSDLHVVAVEVASVDATPNFSATTAKKFDLSPADTDNADDYPVSLSGLTAGKIYALQVFSKTDTTFVSPMLEKNFVNTTMPTLFTSQSLAITPNSAKVKVKDINNYKSGETIFRYWKDGSADAKIDKKIEFADGAKEVEIALDSLDKKSKYKFVVLPVYSQLQTDADNLLENQGEFQTLDLLKAEVVEGNQFTDNVTFKLSGMDSQFPTTQETKVQWRLKPTDASQAWADPADSDSFAFTVASVAADGTYSIEVANQNRTNTWYTGVDYEWRVVKSSDPSVNLVKEGNVEFNLADDKLTKTFNEKIASAHHGDITWHAASVEDIVASGKGNFLGVAFWRTFFGLKTKTQWQHYLEWLAFQSDAVQAQAIKNITLAFQVYQRTTNRTNETQVAIEFTSKFTAVPYASSNGNWEATGGAAENGTYQEFATPTGDDITKFGGFNNNEHSTVTPVKPSDFMSATNRFKDWDSFPKSIQFVLNKIKDGWGGTVKASGISRGNVFATNINALSLDKTFASRINDKKSLDANFTLRPIDSTDSTGWTIETLDSESNANLWSNDLTGELYVKVKATNGTKVHYYWTKISGFNKSADDTTKPVEGDLSFELYPDHSKSSRIIAKELELTTDLAAKKLLIEKYWKVNLASQFKDGWTFVSAAASADGSTITLKAKIPSKVVTKGVVGNTVDKAELSSDVEFTYTLTGFNLESLPPVAHGLSSTQKGNLEATPAGLSAKVRFVHSNWTYNEMLNKMRDAVLQGETQVEALANAMISRLNISDWSDPLLLFHIRTFGLEPLATWGDFVQTPESKKVLEANKNGFVSQQTLGTNNAATRTARIKEMINHYGKMTAPTS